MNILFITLMDIRSINERNIYADLMRAFIKDGHQVTIVSPAENRTGISTGWIKKENRFQLLKVKTGNIQKTGFIEKGISTVLLGPQMLNAVKKYLSNETFDLIIYSTPPVTIAGMIRYLKRKYKAKSYLMLKDITPQTFLDLGALTKQGWKAFIYKYFLKKEKELYCISDIIGCTSPANIDYIKSHNKFLDEKKIRLCPNCIEPENYSVDDLERTELRKKYQLPLQKKIFVYGGNLGIPQDIPFVKECIVRERTREDLYFLLVGSGTEFNSIKQFIEQEKLTNVKLMKGLPSEEYNKMICCCDVGLVFLNRNYTVPNTPSRILSYMQAKIPIIASIDKHNDLQTIIEEANCGWSCFSGDINGFDNIVNIALKDDLKKIGKSGYDYLWSHFTVEEQKNSILKQLEEVENVNF